MAGISHEIIDFITDQSDKYAWIDENGMILDFHDLFYWHDKSDWQKIYDYCKTKAIFEYIRGLDDSEVLSLI
jgi:hypothetical protein